MSKTSFVVLTVTLAALTGCRAGANRQVVITGLTERQDPTVPLAVDIENRQGAVRVIVDRRVTQPTVSVVPSGGSRGRPFRARPPVADQIPDWAAAQIATVDGRSVLRVLGDQPFEKYEDDSLEIVVRLSACQGVRVRNTGGKVELVDVAGAIEVDNGLNAGSGGNIEIRTSRPLKEPIKLSTPHGDISVAMGHGSAGRFELSAPNGDITTELRGNPSKDVLAQRWKWVGTVNDGSMPFVMETGAGSITVDVARHSSKR